LERICNFIVFQIDSAEYYNCDFVGMIMMMEINYFIFFTETLFQTLKLSETLMRDDSSGKFCLFKYGQRNE